MSCGKKTHSCLQTKKNIVGKTNGESGKEASGRLTIRPARDFNSSIGTLTLTKLGSNGSVIENNIGLGIAGGDEEIWNGNPDLTASTLMNIETSKLTVMYSFLFQINFGCFFFAMWN